MLTTTLVGMFLASNHVPDFFIVMWSGLGIALVGGASAAINHIVDHKTDALMRRTQSRPLVQHHISRAQASYFALGLGVLGFLILYCLVNPLTALLSFATLLGYALVYTRILKKMTPQNIVIGGISGAIAPLLGWAAINNDLHPRAWILVMIVFLWTPPHFWSLAIHRLEDYKQASIPMLPVTHGILFTKQCIVLYSVLLLMASLWPCLIGMSGYSYGLVALGVGLHFLYQTIRLYQQSHPQEQIYALQVFKTSLSYVWILFMGLLFDHAYRNYIY